MGRGEGEGAVGQAEVGQLAHVGVVPHLAITDEFALMYKFTDHKFVMICARVGRRWAGRVVPRPAASKLNRESVILGRNYDL